MIKFIIIVRSQMKFRKKNLNCRKQTNFLIFILWGDSRFFRLSLDLFSLKDYKIERNIIIFLDITRRNFRISQFMYLNFRILITELSVVTGSLPPFISKYILMLGYNNVFTFLIKQKCRKRKWDYNWCIYQVS